MIHDRKEVSAFSVVPVGEMDTTASSAKHSNGFSSNLFVLRVSRESLLGEAGKVPGVLTNDFYSSKPLANFCFVRSVPLRITRACSRNSFSV